jgi:peptidoglycan/LPS O-acetylase OafA/YrhL
MIGKSETPPLPEFLFRLCLFVAIVTAVACLTYLLIEAPARAWLRRQLGSGAPRQVLRQT